MMQMLRQIELGRMLALFPVSLAERNARPQLTWRPVEDAPAGLVRSGLAAELPSLAVAAFVRVATAVSAAHDARRRVAPRSHRETHLAAP